MGEEKQFSEKITDILNYGAANAALAIGYQLELFDVMDLSDKPQSIDTIAAECKVDTRYLAEWMGIMVSSGIITLSVDDNGQEMYLLPKEHGDVLTRRAGNSNMGVYTQEIPLLTMSVMDQVVKGFRTGEGIEYSFYPRFQAFMSESANAKHRQVLTSSFLPFVNNGKIVEQLEKGIEVCDLGCGEGVATNLMAEAYPRSSFLGIDIGKEALAIARREAEAKNLGNIEFKSLDASTLAARPDMHNRFDYITAFDAIHDQSHPLESLKGVFAVLKPGGIFSMVDIAAESRIQDNLEHPMAPFLYTVSLLHCMPVGLTDNGTGLGMMWGRDRALDLLHEAGFDSVTVDPIPEDSFNFHYQCSK